MSPMDWLKYCLAKAHQNLLDLRIYPSVCLPVHLDMYYINHEVLILRRQQHIALCLHSLSLSLSLSVSLSLSLPLCRRRNT